MRKLFRISRIQCRTPLPTPHPTQIGNTSRNLAPRPTPTKFDAQTNSNTQNSMAPPSIPPHTRNTPPRNPQTDCRHQHSPPQPRCGERAEDLCHSVLPIKLQTCNFPMNIAKFWEHLFSIVASGGYFWKIHNVQENISGGGVIDLSPQ